MSCDDTELTYSLPLDDISLSAWDSENDLFDKAKAFLPTALKRFGFEQARNTLEGKAQRSDIAESERLLEERAHEWAIGAPMQTQAMILASILERLRESQRIKRDTQTLKQELASPGGSSRLSAASQ